MGKDFRKLEEAIAYKNKMRAAGHKALIEEFWDFDGVYYAVLVW